MKQFLTAALAALSIAGASAKDMAVVTDGVLQPGYDFSPWWNVAATFDAPNPAGEGANVLTFKTGDGGPAGSMGLWASGNTGPLHSATLNFNWYATKAGAEYTVRLTAKAEQNYTFTVTEDQVGKWNTTSVSVAETFPVVAQQWNDFANKDAGFVFSVVAEKSPADAAISFGNIYYSNIDEAWTAPVQAELPKPTTVPVPTADAADVVSLFSGAYTAATTFGVGGWGQATKTEQIEIDGKPVYKLSNFNYLGWELADRVDVSACHYLHVDFFPAEGNTLGFTPISPGQEKGYVAKDLKVGEWNSIDVPLTYWNNVNLKDLFQFKFDQGTGGEGYIGNVYFYRDPNYVEPEKPKAGAVWYGSAEKAFDLNGKTYNVSVNYDITALEDGHFTMNATPEGMEEVPGQVWQLLNRGAWDNFTNNGDGTYTVTSSNTYQLGERVYEFAFWVPYAGGLLRMDIDYNFGDANEKPAATIAPKLRNVSVSDITATTAVLNYEVALPAELEGAVVMVIDGENVYEQSPVTLTDLTPNTEYTHTLVAVAMLGDMTYESKPATVTFKTLRDGAVAMVWHGIADGMAPNAFLPGEDPNTSRRNIPVSAKVTVTYNPDQTLSADVYFQGQLPVGAVPHATFNGKFDRKPMTLVEGQHYTVNTTGVKYDEGEAIEWLYFFIAYDGGATGNEPRVFGYTVGMENEGADYGTPAAIDLSTANSVFLVGQSAPVIAVVKDSNGHFLLNEAVSLSSDSPAFVVEGAKLTAADKGQAVITGSAGDLSTALTVKCVASANAKQLIDATAVVTSDLENTAAAFDGNEGTQIEWSCAETQEHFIDVKFANPVDIEAIELVWEGAAATQYTVTVETLADGDAVAEPCVFTVTDGQGGAGVTPRNIIYREDYNSMAATGVKLQTGKAFEPAWGIKLKEMRVLGSERQNTGCADIDADTDGTVQYFNLQGMRVAQPAAGQVYIVRRGSKVAKVVM